MAGKGAKTLGDATLIGVGETSDPTPIAELTLDANGHRSAWWKISPSSSTFARIRAYASQFQSATRSLDIVMWVSFEEDPTEADLLRFGWDDNFITGAYGSTDAQVTGAGLAAGGTYYVQVLAEDGFLGSIELRVHAIPEIDARPLLAMSPDPRAGYNWNLNVGGIPAVSPSGEFWATYGTYGEPFIAPNGPALNIWRRNGDVLEFVGSWRGPATNGRGGFSGQDFIRDYYWIDDSTLVFIFDLANSGQGNNIELRLIRVKGDGTLQHSHVMAGWFFELFSANKMKIVGDQVTIPCRTGKPTATTGQSFPGLATFSIAGGVISGLSQTPFAAISATDGAARCDTLIDGRLLFSNNNTARLYSSTGTPLGPAWPARSVIPNQSNEWEVWDGPYGAGEHAWYAVTRYREGTSKSELLWARVNPVTGSLIEEIALGVIGPGGNNVIYSYFAQTEPNGRYLHAVAGWQVGFTQNARIFTLDTVKATTNIRPVIVQDDDVNVEGGYGLRGASGIGGIQLDGLQSVAWLCTIPAAADGTGNLKEQRRRFW